jgi:hypothetical protein
MEKSFAIAAEPSLWYSLLVRYEMRQVNSGWTVWDTQTNAPAVVEGRWQVDLNMEDADDLTDLLNRLDREAAQLSKQ